jgi:hypothetical protein
VPMKGIPMREFKVEGSPSALRHLAQTINAALRGLDRGADDQKVVRATKNDIAVEVRVLGDGLPLRPAIDECDDFAQLAQGWAERKRCRLCQKLVALLFDDAYLESAVADGEVACVDCWATANDEGRTV